MFETPTALASRPMMLIAAQCDTLTTLEVIHASLVAEFKRHGVQLEGRMFDADHSLASHRIALARVTLTFLQHHV